jgi:hypothetical protein
MKILVVTILLCLNGCLMVAAQNDSTEYIYGLPVTGDDTVSPPSGDALPKDILIRISHDKLPRQLIKMLDNEELYQGWREAPVFKARNTGLFILYLKKGNATRRYGFNERGKPVTFSETSGGVD